MTAKNTTKSATSGQLGNRNPIVLIARQRNGGVMRDRRARRQKERTRREIRDQW